MMWGAMNVIDLADALHARVGDYPKALVFEGREYSSGELRRMQLRLAGALVEMGVGRGDRVAVITPNCPEVGITYAATWRIGAVTVPILFLLAQSEIEHILGDAEPSVVVTSSEFLGNITSAIAGMANPPRVLLVGDEGAEGAEPMTPLLTNGPERETVADMDPDDLAGINYTGGTTGHPKGVMLTHGGMTAVSNAAMSTGDYEDGSVGLGALPLAHGYGILTQLLGMRVAGTGVLMRWFEPGEALRLIQEHQVNLFAAVPTMLVYLLNHPDLDRYDVSSLERVGCGAAPCPVELLEEFERRFGCTIYEGYGLTESTVVCTTQRRDRPKVVGSVGVALPGFTVKILDDDHNEIPVGELGEICVSGPNVMKGYYRMPDVTAETVRDGWLHTGDIGRMDADGNLYIVDRKKDMIIRGGLNVYPRDIEEVLFEHPAVAEAAVIGRPDPRYGEEVIAFVVLRRDAKATADDILTFCRERLAKYKAPKEVHFLDSLPRSGVGKVVRRELRDRLAEMAPAQGAGIG
jgi:long-chain acyl-CoA synthetase